MKTSFNRNEKVLGLVTLGMITVFTAFFVKLNSNSKASTSHIETGSQINYQMARPAEAFSEYSLNGRDIDQTYEGLKPRELAQHKKAEAVKAPAAKAKTEAEKKAEAAKKKADEAQKASAQARAAQTEQARKTALENRAREQQAAAQKAETQASSDNNASADNHVGQAGAVNNTAAVNPVNPADDKNKDKDKKSFAQWRTLIFATPKTETIDAFLAAYRKGDITEAEVQAMATDLLDQNSESLKGLGLYTLRSAPSMASLSQMVHIESQMSSSYQSYIEQAYLSYLQPKNVGYLNQALKTTDSALITKSLSLLSTNLAKLASGQNSALVDPRSGREAGAGSNITMSQFSVLLSALNTLAQNNQYSATASTVISYIESSGAVAQNSLSF